MTFYCSLVQLIGATCVLAYATPETPAAQDCTEGCDADDESGLLQSLQVTAKARTTGALMEDPSAESTEEVPGSVYYLLTYGAPGSASPGLSDRQKPDGCFSGLRAWTSQSGRFLSWVDFAPFITHIVGLRHPRVNAIDFNVDEPVNSQRFDCSPELTRLPNRGTPSIELHRASLYIEMCNAVEPLMENLSIIAGRKSYIDDIPSVAQNVRQYGWCLVGTSYHPGNWIVGGAQVSHLFQDPKTLDCALTFQGSSSPQDWGANARFSAAHFCGLVGPDESCLGRLWECPVRKEGSSFVHRGFRDHLMTLVRHPSFQDNIRSQLHACKRLTVAGHSLGGALSSLFTACVNNAPKHDEYGYEDYKYIGFNKGIPKPLECKK
eukprot:TRINITY_DN24840_c0_g1_i1.p1 TRINITY_DN24840_c0_g1~~TRINITY_DN24840_c0_g1_i1.p1  ORF type:complete len:378 (+),score=42.92 TRINITY_DN24840_c0_g1_i1:75-1208(+)